MSKFIIKFGRSYFIEIREHRGVQNYIFYEKFSDAMVFDSKEEAHKCVFNFFDKHPTMIETERKKVHVVEYELEKKEIDWNNSPKDRFCFISKDKTCFIGFNSENNKLVLNANSWSSIKSVFILETIEDDESTVNTFLEWVCLLTKKQFIAVDSKQLWFKKYNHFVNNDSKKMFSNAPCSCVNNEPPQEVELPDFITNYKEKHW